MVGFRVFDVGLLILWLLWFFRLRDDDDDQQDEGGGGGGPGPGRDPKPGGGGGGLRKRLPAGPRLRGPLNPRKTGLRRGVHPMPRPLPMRVRRPRAPEPVRR
jgi:hypothetical protein